MSVSQKLTEIFFGISDYEIYGLNLVVLICSLGATIYFRQLYRNGRLTHAIIFCIVSEFGGGWMQSFLMGGPPSFPDSVTNVNSCFLPAIFTMILPDSIFNILECQFVSHVCNLCYVPKITSTIAPGFDFITQIYPNNVAFCFLFVLVGSMGGMLLTDWHLNSVLGLPPKIAHITLRIEAVFFGAILYYLSSLSCMPQIIRDFRYVIHFIYFLVLEIIYTTHITNPFFYPEKLMSFVFPGVFPGVFKKKTQEKPEKQLDDEN